MANFSQWLLMNIKIKTVFRRKKSLIFSQEAVTMHFTAHISYFIPYFTTRQEN